MRRRVSVKSAHFAMHIVLLLGAVAGLIAVTPSFSGPTLAVDETARIYIDPFTGHVESWHGPFYYDTATGATVTLGSSHNTVVFDVRQGNERWSILLGVPGDQEFAPGAYENADNPQGGADNTPNIRVEMIEGSETELNGCGSPGGRFVIDEVEGVEELGLFTITKFSARWEQKCAADAAWMNGEIRYNSDLDIAAMGASPSIEYPETPVGEVVTGMATVTNLGTVTQAIGPAVIEDDTAGAFAITEDCAVAALAPGESCDISVSFTPDIHTQIATANLVVPDDTTRGERGIRLIGPLQGEAQTCDLEVADSTLVFSDTSATVAIHESLILRGTGWRPGQNVVVVFTDPVSDEEFPFTIPPDQFGVFWEDFFFAPNDPPDSDPIDWGLSAGQLGSACVDNAAVRVLPLTDVWASPLLEHIKWLYETGISRGCTPILFCPNSAVTRGQMAAFLSRALELPPATQDYFIDDNGSIFESDINRLRLAGIAGGCNVQGPRFCPNSQVTRGQMAAFLSRAFDLPDAMQNYFSDDNGSAFEADINRVRAAGITLGCTETTYCPSSVVTRAQMAAFLHRALD